MPDDAAIRTLFATIDGGDLDAVIAWFAPAVHFQMGSMPPLDGRDTVRAAFARFVDTFESIHHEIRAVLRGDPLASHEAASVEAVVTYRLRDGRALTVPCTSTLRFAGGKVADYRIFIDLAPLNAMLDEAASRRARNEASVRRFQAFLEALDFERWTLLFAEDGVQENPFAPAGFPTEFRGRKDLKAHWTTLGDTYDWMRFPNVRIHSCLDPNEVIVEFDGDIKIKARQRKYDNRYCCMFWFDEAGLIKTYREYFNPAVLTGAFDYDGPRLHGLPPRQPTQDG